MAHPSTEELATKLRAALATGENGRPSPERVKLLRELADACPTFTPAVLSLARTLLVTEEPGVEPTAAFDEVQRLLEQAVQGSNRSAPALIELAYFIDSIRNSSETARPLLEEGAAKALASLEDAWAGLIRSWTLDGMLSEALALAERAEKVFPGSVRIMNAVEDARASAARRTPPGA